MYMPEGLSPLDMRKNQKKELGIEGLKHGIDILGFLFYI